MADDKTTKTPEQPVTDSGPGKAGGRIHGVRSGKLRHGRRS